jgi:hypothetical protein
VCVCVCVCECRCVVCAYYEAEITQSGGRNYSNWRNKASILIKESKKEASAAAGNAGSKLKEENEQNQMRRGVEPKKQR